MKTKKSATQQKILILTSFDNLIDIWLIILQLSQAEILFWTAS